jgi:hypothetical protein
VVIPVLVAVQVVVMDIPGANAAEQAVVHKIDGISPDVLEAVAVLGIHPPESTVIHLVVTACEEDYFLPFHDFVVPAVQDGNAEVVHFDMAAVPEFLMVPDA